MWGMHVAVAKVVLHLPGVHDLKGKRRVVKSLCARVRNRFDAVIAEVGDNELRHRATVGIAAVSKLAAARQPGGGCGSGPYRGRPGGVRGGGRGGGGYLRVLGECHPHPNPLPLSVHPPREGGEDAEGDRRGRTRKSAAGACARRRSAFGR